MVNWTTVTVIWDRVILPFRAHTHTHKRQQEQKNRLANKHNSLLLIFSSITKYEVTHQDVVSAHDKISFCPKPIHSPRSKWWIPRWHYFCWDYLRMSSMGEVDADDDNNSPLVGFHSPRKWRYSCCLHLMSSKSRLLTKKTYLENLPANRLESARYAVADCRGRA